MKKRLANLKGRVKNFVFEEVDAPLRRPVSKPRIRSRLSSVKEALKRHQGAGRRHLQKMIAKRRVKIMAKKAKKAAKKVAKKAAKTAKKTAKKAAKPKAQAKVKTRVSKPKIAMRKAVPAKAAQPTVVRNMPQTTRRVVPRAQPIHGGVSMRRTMRRPMSRRSFLRGAGMTALGAGAAMAGRNRLTGAVVGDPAQPPAAPGSAAYEMLLDWNLNHVLQNVQESGVLRVGIRDGNTMFRRNQGTTLPAAGLDPELGRAVARAIGVDVQFSEIGGDDRWVLVSTYQTDINFRNITIKLGRDTKPTSGGVVYENVDISPMYYLDNGDVLFKTDADAAGWPDGTKKVAVKSGTTTYTTLQGICNETTDLIVVGSDTDLKTAYNTNNAIGIAQDRTTLLYWEDNGEISGTKYYSAQHGEFLSKETLGALIGDRDEDFRDVVNWVIWAFMVMEDAYGIGGDSAGQKLHNLDMQGDLLKIGNGWASRALAVTGDWWSPRGDNSDPQPAVGSGSLGVKGYMRDSTPYSTLLKYNDVPSSTLNRLWTDGGVLVPPNA